MVPGCTFPVFAIVASGANVPDVKLLDATLRCVVHPRPRPRNAPRKALCMDAGYVGYEALATTRMQNYEHNLKHAREPTPRATQQGI
jgi:hypothetical protein